MRQNAKSDAPRRRFRPVLELLEDRLTPATLPTGFQEAIVASGISNATAMELAPDGRLWVLEQGGEVEVFHGGSTTGFTALDLPTSAISSSGERGLLGIALDPSYDVASAAPDYVYLYYTSTASPNPHNRVSRFTVNNSNPDQPVLGSELVILELDALSATNHNGGAIHFGPDGKLYIAVGDNVNGSNAQSLNTLHGKMLRINADGTIPSDNPFYTQTTGNNRAIWALGLRNPFTFTFQPGTGRMHINDVGQISWEEINVGAAGANYGWPSTEGDFNQSQFPGFTRPFYSYSHGSGGFQGFAITGGAFYNPASPGGSAFPASYSGDYFFADYVNDWINVIDLSTGSVSQFATGALGAVDLRVAPDGALHYLTRGEGRVYRVIFNGSQPPVLEQPANQTMPSTQDTVSVTLSATDPDSSNLTYSAIVQSQAYQLDQQHGFFTDGNLWENYGGQGEKWFLASGNVWQFIKPNGQVFRWDGVVNEASGTLIASMETVYHATPSLLYNATPGATVSVAGNVLTLNPNTGFVGKLFVTATASDGTMTDSRTFTVAVTGNQPPLLAQPAQQTMPTSQDTLSVTLSASDPENDPVTFSATVQSEAHQFDQQFGFFSNGNLWENWGGQGEKWFLAGGDIWHFIKPNGQVFRWDGSSQATGTLIATLETVYHADPSKLYGATLGATASVSGNVLTVNPTSGFIGKLFVTVVASAAGGTDAKTFTVTVTA